MENRLQLPSCFICGSPLRVSLTKSKKGKVAVALTCPTDGRHLRAFCNHQPFVREIVTKAETASDQEALQKPFEGLHALPPRDGKGSS